MKDIIFINTHPIQYFTPMYKYMNEKGVKTKAWYCSDETIKGGFDKEFGVNVKWDIPLLSGYEYRFFKNYSWKPSLANGFWGLVNFGIITELFRIPKSVIIVHGWNYFTHFFVIAIARLKGHTVCLRCEMPQNQEIHKNGWKMAIKKFGLKFLVFPNVNYFLYIGKQNLLFYKAYGIGNQKLIFCPYSVDDVRFRNEKNILKSGLINLKSECGIPQNDKVILYTGKYMAKKRPMDLLKAFQKLNHPHCWLIMVGEGELRQEMEKFIAHHQLKQVILTGFINQSKVSEYYVISDVFVMCSTIGETWGLSVNEAMNFGLPVIISDMTGCSEDLVIDGDNGYVFETGNIDQLYSRLRDTVVANKLLLKSKPENIIDRYSYQTVTENIRLLTC